MVGGQLEVDTALLTKVKLALASTPSFNASLRAALSDAESQRCATDDTPHCSTSSSSNSLSLLSEDSVGTLTDDSASDSSVSLDAPGDGTSAYDGDDCAFFVCDLGEVKRQHAAWRALLPRIEPWYAVKCNPARELVATLVALNGNSDGGGGSSGGLDCASKVEIELALSLGVAPGDIIFANPCKPAAHLRYARDVGVTLMTFDNAEELAKIARVHPRARLLLRLLVDDSSSVCRFGEKYGAPIDAAHALFSRALSLDLDVVGVSFHVGSGCRDARAFAAAVALARRAFDAAAAAGCAPLALLDCGGGFPGAGDVAYTGEIDFCAIAAELGRAVDAHFPDRAAVRVIAEPGRYFACSAATLVTQVHSKRVVVGGAAAAGGGGCGAAAAAAQEEEERAKAPQRRAMYYLNDGVYGSFNCIIFDHYVVSPRVLTRKGALYSDADTNEAHLLVSSLWGPTCDSMDCVMRSVPLPELEVGDWLAFHNMGAYTGAAASNFNGLYSTRTLYIDTSAA